MFWELKLFPSSDVGQGAPALFGPLQKASLNTRKISHTNYMYIST